MRRFLVVLSLAAVTATTAAAAQPRAKVLVKKTSLGAALVDARGHSLYLRTKGACTGSCLSLWPPLTSAAKPLAGAGVKASLLGTVKRNGKLQVTYKGHPLYRFAEDLRAGDVNGEGMDGIWFLVAPSGNRIAPTSTTPPPATTTPGYGGYGP